MPDQYPLLLRTVHYAVLRMPPSYLRLDGNDALNGSFAVLLANEESLVEWSIFDSLSSGNLKYRVSNIVTRIQQHEIRFVYQLHTEIEEITNGCCGLHSIVESALSYVIALMTQIMKKGVVSYGDCLTPVPPDSPLNRC